MHYTWGISGMDTNCCRARNCGARGEEMPRACADTSPTMHLNHALTLNWGAQIDHRQSQMRLYYQPIQQTESTFANEHSMRICKPVAVGSKPDGVHIPPCGMVNAGKYMLVAFLRVIVHELGPAIIAAWYASRQKCFQQPFGEGTRTGLNKKNQRKMRICWALPLIKNSF